MELHEGEPRKMEPCRAARKDLARDGAEWVECQGLFQREGWKHS